MSKIVSKEYLEYNPFYIVRDGGVFQMRFKGNHYVISTATSHEEIMRNAKVIYERYNTPWMLEEAMREVRTRISDKEKLRRDAQFKRYGKEYEQELQELIRSLTNVSHKLLKKKKPANKIKLKFNK